MAGYVALQAFRAPTGLNFEPLGEAFDTIGETLRRNRLLEQQKELGQSLMPGASPSGSNPYQAPTNRLMATGPQASPAAQGLAANAADFIKREEGYAPQAKWDVRQNSGGYGSRAAPGETFTQEKADSYLQRDMQPTEAWINKNVPNATAEQRTALHSFGYNLGTGALDNLKPQIQAGDWSGVAQRMQLYNKARTGPGGALQPLDGLTARRGREAALLTSGGSSAAPAQAPSMNYAAGIQTALRQGNTALAMQLQNAQQEAEATAYNRNRQGVADNRAAETHDLATTQAREELHQSFTKRVGSIAQVISSETDPAKKSAMWQRFIQADPRFGSSLQQYGIDPSDVEGGTRALMAEAGLTSGQGLTEVSPGATLYDPRTNKSVFTAPERTTAASLPAGYRQAGDGKSLEFIPGGPADPAVKPKGRDKYTEAQTKAANFGNMMVKAEGELQKTAGVNPDGTPKPISNPKNILGATRDALVPLESARNAMRPDETQAYEQSASQWIRAKLRKESGAAIGKDEMQKEFETYFPQYWDGPETIARKARARNEATQGMIAESAGAHELLFQGQPETQAAPAPTDNEAPVRVASPDEAMKLPSGTVFMTPDGRTKVRP